MENITKIYDNSVKANDKVHFSLIEGEIHSLIGENGAGKSTLMKVLFGSEVPDEGKIYLDGEEVSFSSPLDAIDHGIGMVHQHFMLVPSMSAEENIMLGTEPTKHGVIDKKNQRSIVEHAMVVYQLFVPLGRPVKELSVAEMQKVEILKALVRGVSILVLDEPTAVLTPQETEEFFVQLDHLKKQGITIVFISHKLDEIKRVSDRITVMRSGKYIGTYENINLNEEEISNLMIGNENIVKIERTVNGKSGKPYFTANNIKYTNNLKSIDISKFVVREGEIVGIAGVEGNGQIELVEIITGMTNKKFDGELTFGGEAKPEWDIFKYRDAGFGYVPADRMTRGCSLEDNLVDNYISTLLDDNDLSEGLFIDYESMDVRFGEAVNKYNIRCSSTNQHIGMLSGGNIQKVIMAREMYGDPEFIVADQPTRGVDVGAASIIHQELLNLRDQGSAILLVSADLNEVLTLSDKIVTLYKGEITGVFENTPELTEEELGLYMLGAKKMGEVTF